MSILIIPHSYLYAACIILSFIMFSAGGVAFEQSMFYGALFIILAVALFFLAVHFGRQTRHDGGNAVSGALPHGYRKS